VLDLQGQQQQNGLQALLATVHIVSKKQVVGVWWQATYLEKMEEILELTMDIPKDFQRRIQLKQRWL